MGRKKLNPLRDNSVKELEVKILTLKTELSKERASISSGTRAEKPSKIRNARRQIARLLTIINEKNSQTSGVSK
ncbi:MAG TPA: 50S ribosomal protein L29 [archaeon]|nr:50S ribosomal protein L29 [archaeon]